jgi:hypothetical protein
MLQHRFLMVEQWTFHLFIYLKKLREHGLLSAHAWNGLLHLCH